ncbi:MAG: DUF885 domain-containing protein [Brevundimonas sp.]|jgi:uncharacterized protein (DUF885 family)|uniref:DUF885 domain-containing protein n=1 Tax=Brevundimonas sp. TaxID=1871086 RepID=UPI00391B0137
MIDRRHLLFSAAAGAALAASGVPVAARPRQDAGSALHALLDGLARDLLLTSPETLTALGLDSGENAAMKARLDDRSIDKVEADKALMRSAIQQLKTLDRAAMSPTDQVYRDTLEVFGDTVISSYDIPYGGGLFPSPYTVSQLTGVYQSIPDFLDSQHSIATRADAEAYLSRVAAFAKALDQETGRAQLEHAAGAIPPDFVIARTLTQLEALTGTPAAESGLVRSLARRAAQAGLEGDWAARATAVVEGEVYPALARQADALRAVQPRAVSDPGVWRLPQGDAWYDFALRYFTTSTLSADEIHQLGLDQVAELSARADLALRRLGLTQGSVGERIGALGREPAQLYANTDEAKAQLLADLNAQMADMAARLPAYFGRIPTSPVEIRRVPVAIELGAPGGYYQPPSLDGSRPGAYYINLRDTAEWPRFSLPTLTYHEASPGHHHQIALQQERADAPLLMKVLGFSAYAEGWALYAEQLADEMGVYADNPAGEVGYLQSLMFRAARLVVDTGLHQKRWSREQGVRYMVDTLGDQESSITTEVERYAVWAGQACSYKVGHVKWVELRERARAQLGDRFDIRGFHDTALDAGGVPLTVLERVIDDWIAARAA